MSDATGHIELERNIDGIVVGVRHRKDLGDIDSLMRSIEEVGLLQPITITPDGVLVCGRRRLEAVRRLGWHTLKVWVRSRISDELSHVLAQQAENTERKPLTQLEAAAMFREVKLLMEEDSERRQRASQFGATAATGEDNGAGHCPAPRGEGDTRNQAAQFVTGTQSYHRLEKIGWLEDVHDDESRTCQRSDRSRARRWTRSSGVRRWIRRTSECEPPTASPAHPATRSPNPIPTWPAAPKRRWNGRRPRTARSAPRDASGSRAARTSPCERSS